MRALRKSIRSAESKNDPPNLQRLLAASHSAHAAMVFALARLNQRVQYGIRVPTSLDPFNSMFRRMSCQSSYSEHYEKAFEPEMFSRPLRMPSAGTYASSSRHTRSCCCSHMCVPYPPAVINVCFSPNAMPPQVFDEMFRPSQISRAVRRPRVYCEPRQLGNADMQHIMVRTSKPCTNYTATRAHPWW